MNREHRIGVYRGAVFLRCPARAARLTRLSTRFYILTIEYPTRNADFVSMNAYKTAWIAALLLVGTVVAAEAVPLDLSSYRGENHVIVIFARARDEPRAFSFNLALSSEWDRIESRKIETVDVGPGRYDLDGVARQLGIRDAEFSIVVVGLDGTVLHRTADPGALSTILMIIDQELHRDHDSVPG